MAEFALVLPVLLLILLVGVDFGRVFLGWVTLNNAARVAANYAASNSASGSGVNLTDYQTLVLNETQGIDCALDPILDPTYNPGTPTVGGQAVANLSCRFQFVTPFVGVAFPGGLHVGASSNFPIRSGVLANIGAGTPPTTLPPNQDFAFETTSGPVSTVSGPAGLTVGFLLLAQNGGAATGWSWTFGDGTGSSSEYPPEHAYSTPGTYTVQLTETNAAGSSPTYSHDVIVTGASFYGTVPAPCATLPGPQSVQCGGDPTVTGSTTSIDYTWPMTVNFTNTSTSTTGATYSWNFGDGTGPSTAQNPSHTYLAPGTYTVTLTVTASDGTTSTATISNYINAGCVVPSFTGVNSALANGMWTNAHFVSSDLYYYDRSAHAYTQQAPSPSYTIQQQNPQGGLFHSASGGTCSPGTTGEKVAPNGANPAP